MSINFLYNSNNNNSILPTVNPSNLSPISISNSLQENILFSNINTPISITNIQNEDSPLLTFSPLYSLNPICPIATKTKKDINKKNLIKLRYLDKGKKIKKLKI